jgi:hypothetical protein
MLQAIRPTTHTVYIYTDAVGRGDDAYARAIGDDGALLAQGYCTNDEYARRDMGGIPGVNQDLRDMYASHFDGPISVEFVPCRNRDSHEGLRAALEANKRHATDIRDYARCTITKDGPVGPMRFTLRVHYDWTLVSPTSPADDGIRVSELHIAAVESFEMCGEPFLPCFSEAAFVEIIRRKFGDDCEIEAACLKDARQRIER